MSSFTYTVNSLVALAALTAFGLPARMAAAEKSSATQLVAMAKAADPMLRDAITTTFEAKDLKEGTAWAERGADFFFAVETAAKPELVIDGAAEPAMQQIAGSDLWYSGARIEQLGKLHAFHYVINGAKFGGK